MTQFPEPVGMPDSVVDVAVLVFDLRASGVVRNAIRIAEAARKDGLRTQLWVVHASGAMMAEVPPGMEVICLADTSLVLRGCEHRALATFLAVGVLARALQQHRPRVLFSAGNHVHWLAGKANALADWPSRLVMRASNDMFHRRNSLWGMLTHVVRRRINGALMRRIFSEADQVVAVSRDLACQLRRGFGLPHVSVIPNGVPCEVVAEHAREPLDHPWFAPDEPPVIMGIGRLVRQKNFPLLVQAFARVRSTRPCRLVILGEGTDAACAELMRQARALGVADDVLLAGFDRNPHKYLARAALFVLSSSWEGSSNALLEALACGCPVVSTDCPSGSREVLAHGRYGPLVPLEDAEALAAAINWRLDQPRGSEELQARAAMFGADRMLAAYASLLVQAAGYLDRKPLRPPVQETPAIERSRAAA